MATEGPLTTDRRTLLRAGAAGAITAGAWVTPAVLSMDTAGAAGSCPTNLTFDWPTNCSRIKSGYVGTMGAPNGVDIRVESTAFSGVVNNGDIYDNWMTRTATAANLPCGVNCGSAATTNWPRGNVQNFYSLLMHDLNETSGLAADADCTDAGTAARFVEVEFGFYVQGSTTQRVNVQNLAFSLLDVDASTNNYRDQAAVSINGNAVTTPVTLGVAAQAQAFLCGAGSPVGTCTTSTPTIATPGATAVFQANAGQSSDASSNRGVVRMVFNSGVNVNRVRIRFTDILGSAPQTIQWIGIGPLTFCKGTLA